MWSKRINIVFILFLNLNILMFTLLLLKWDKQVQNNEPIYANFFNRTHIIIWVTWTQFLWHCFLKTCFFKSYLEHWTFRNKQNQVCRWCAACEAIFTDLSTTFVYFWPKWSLEKINGFIPNYLFLPAKTDIMSLKIQFIFMKFFPAFWEANVLRGIHNKTIWFTYKI